MATLTATPHQIVPLHLSGNTTEQQNRLLQEFLGEAVKEAFKTAIEQLDRQSAQSVLDMDKKLKREVADRVVEVIHRHTVSDKYKDEEVRSDRVYPTTYRVRPIEAQVTELRKLFPSLGSCQEKLARRELPEGAEAWFAVPRWQALGSTYNEAVETCWAFWPRSGDSQTGSWANLEQCTFARRNGPRWRRRYCRNSRRATTSWWWRRRPECCIAALRPGGRGWRWPVTSLAWAYFRLAACC